MILQSLYQYYEQLAAKGVLPRLGWNLVKIAWALEIDENGRLLQVLPLKSETTMGKKTVSVPREMELPSPVKRTVGILPNYLWDTATYLLGIDNKGNPTRTENCFLSAKELHTAMLEGCEDPFAKAICAFFSTWDPSSAAAHSVIAPHLEELSKGENITFCMHGVFACENAALCDVWQKAFHAQEAGVAYRCLITGDLAVPESTHPSIMKVPNAQSSGAALVSFNADAFCSYAKEQNMNAPVSKYAAFGYTAALNYLIAARRADGKLRFSTRIGDMTVVYWCEDADPHYQDFLTAVFDRNEATISDDDLHTILCALAEGRSIDWEEASLKPTNRFTILGISPNAARLSIRFFLQSRFGDIMRHVREHDERLQIVKPSFDRWNDIPLWALLNETVNQNARDKTPSPQMSGDVLRAILTGCRYPATLYQQTMLRIRAEHTITRGRAAILKAYLLRNTNSTQYKEALTVELNEQTSYQPYVLGRLFSVLEAIQEKANPGINATIRDKYFTSACATPSVIFPILLNLAQKHLKKMDERYEIYYSKQISALTEKIVDSYPKHMTLEDQGIFQLGYYHQTQKRFEKKTIELKEDQEHV